MSVSNHFVNEPLFAGILAGVIAQVIKLLMNYYRHKSWNWALLLSAGGMPSSHASLVAGVTHSIGLNFGYSSPIFAVSCALAAIVIYDATGIRRQAGKHAVIINRMITDLATGHPLKEELLREVLGHTPLEAFAGTILGLVVAQIIWMI